jgi:hypothetical protein
MAMAVGMGECSAPAVARKRADAVTSRPSNACYACVRSREFAPTVVVYKNDSRNRLRLGKKCIYAL